MIDNIELIKPLLNFKSEDDYYFLQILQRKKDRDQIPFKLGGSNNNSRLVKAYNISSIDYLEERYDEIKALCNLFHARASICLNKRSYKSSSLQMMIRLAQSIQGENYRNAKMWNNVSGVYHPIKDKTWIIDIDKEDMDRVDEINDAIIKCKPIGKKIITKIPSKTGLHIITQPFDLKEFGDWGLDIHKNNPTNLYIP